MVTEQVRLNLSFSNTSLGFTVRTGFENSSVGEQKQSLYDLYTVHVYFENKKMDFNLR